MAATSGYGVAGRRSSRATSRVMTASEVNVRVTVGPERHRAGLRPARGPAAGGLLLPGKHLGHGVQLLGSLRRGFRMPGIHGHLVAGPRGPRVRVAAEQGPEIDHRPGGHLA